MLTQLSLRTVVIHQNVNKYRRGYVTVEIKHPHREAFANLIGSPRCIRICVIKRVAGKAISPVTGRIHSECAVQTLNDPAAGYVYPVTIYIQDFQR